MPDDYIPEAEPGQPIRASAWNTLRRMVLRNRVHIDGSNGLVGTQGVDGLTIALDARPSSGTGTGSPLIKLVSNETITAATWDGSGNITPGSGNATVLEWDGVSEWTPTGAVRAVSNPYRGTVPEARLVWCAEIGSGPGLELVASECFAE